MADLKIDTTVLVEAGSNLRVVADEFQHADARSDIIADACADRELASLVREFADNWDDKRKKMLGQIAALADAAQQSGEAFEQLEDEFVASLTGKDQ